MNKVVIPPTLLHFLNDSILSVTPLTGGSVCNTYKIVTHTQAYVYKHLNNAPKEMFNEEQLGLSTLQKTSCFKTPYIYLCENDFILMEYITPVMQPRWQQVGEQLANLHRNTHTEYGFANNNYLATIPQNNQWQKNWLDFYREQRLLPLVKHPLFNETDHKRWNILLNKLERYIDNSEPAALIHGDLWNTNIVFSEQEIYLIDPASYYASREIEIAYLEFVGDDHNELLLAYQENYPISQDYTERKNLYLLYPYLVHLHLYGDSYLPGIQNILKYYC